MLSVPQETVGHKKLRWAVTICTMIFDCKNSPFVPTIVHYSPDQMTPLKWNLVNKSVGNKYTIKYLDVQDYRKIVSDGAV